MSSALAAGTAPNVVASIRPLHGLVAAVMDGIGEPDLLVSGAQSPHHFTLTPSAAKRLQRADVVFVIGLGLMPGLERAIGPLAAKARVVDLSHAPGLRLLPLRGLHREGENDDEHAHGHSHGHRGDDPHYWLDPLNAKAMTKAIAAALAEADPKNAASYRRRAATLERNLEQLYESADKDLAPVRTRPFIVYHDAFQYLEKRFGLRSTGAIAQTPETAPGAQRMRATQNTIRELDRPCVFTEPGARPKLLDTLIAGADARVAVIDPLGTAVERGPRHYFSMTMNNIEAIAGCLGRP